MIQISLYRHAKDNTSKDVTDLSIFLDNIQSGKWQDQILKIRTEKDKDKQKELKNRLPAVTISGTFSSRLDKNLIDHSGFIGIDIDDMNPNEVKELLAPDPHVYSVFTSCRGHGACVVFKINGARHKDAFYGIGAYLLKEYGIIMDVKAVNVGRLRFVSYDPDLFLNEGAKKFTQYLPAQKKIKRTKVIFVKNDFEDIVKQLQSNRIDITDDYRDWLRIGFGIADKFGDAGRVYFHAISEMSSKYDHNKCDRQYSSCLQAKGFGATIATFYWLAKNAGCTTYSTQTKEVIKIASTHKRSGLDNKGSLQAFEEFSEYDLDILNEIIPQVDSDTIIEDVSLVEIVEQDIKFMYDIRRNTITRNIEFKKGAKYIRLETRHFNSIFLRLKKMHSKLSSDLVDKIIISEQTPDFDPFLDFFESNKGINTTGHIEALSNTITSDFGLKGHQRLYFIKKWMVGVISAAHGVHSPLMLCLCGKTQNTGKTEFFRRLLPEPIRKEYYGESKLDAGKDDEILMTQKLLILDDEMGGKSKRDTDRLKELCSKQTFSLREPYGRANVDLNRIAVLCGTTNREGVLNDHTGNRRIIPINVIKIDHDAYNAIDKTALFMEAYHLYTAKFDWRINRDDIDMLAGETKDFEMVSPEEELLFRYFRLPKIGDRSKPFLTTEIKSIIEKNSMQKIGLKNLGQVLTKYLNKIDFKNDSGVRTKGWKLIQKESFGGPNEEYLTESTTDAKSAPESDANDESDNIDPNHKISDNEPFTLF